MSTGPRTYRINISLIANMNGLMHQDVMAILQSGTAKKIQLNLIHHTLGLNTQAIIFSTELIMKTINCNNSR
jgi:hypothetical protein